MRQKWSRSKHCSTQRQTPKVKRNPEENSVIIPRHIFMGVRGLEDGIRIEQYSKANFVRIPGQALEGHDLLAIQTYRRLYKCSLNSEFTVICRLCLFWVVV